MINFDIFLIKPITQDYESVISDIEETLSILSRNSRSNTPASEICFSSRTPTPSFGQINYFSMTDLIQKENKSISDKHIIPIVTVFDDLKDYLSDSDLSLDYRIARQRRRQKNTKNPSKPGSLSTLLKSEKKCGEKEEMAKLTNKKSNDQVKEILPRSVTCPSIASLDTSVAQRDFISCLNISPGPGANVNSQNGPEKSSDKESLLKNKQENDCSVKKINNSGDVKSVRGDPENSENVLKKVNISRIRTCKSEGKFPGSSTSGQVSRDEAELGSSFCNIFHATSISPGPISRAAVNKAVSDYSRPSDLLSRQNIAGQIRNDDQCKTTFLLSLSLSFSLCLSEGILN